MAKEGYDSLYAQKSENGEMNSESSAAGDTKAVKPVIDDRYVNLHLFAGA